MSHLPILFNHIENEFLLTVGSPYLYEMRQNILYFSENIAIVQYQAYRPDGKFDQSEVDALEESVKDVMEYAVSIGLFRLFYTKCVVSSYHILVTVETVT